MPPVRLFPWILCRRASAPLLWLEGMRHFPPGRESVANMNSKPDAEARASWKAAREMSLPLDCLYMLKGVWLPNFYLALPYSSHALLDRLQAMRDLDVKTVYASKNSRHFFQGMARYYTRAAGKTSPFSYFTAVAPQRLSGGTEDSGHSFHFFREFQPSVTPNVSVLPALYDVLLCEPAFYASLSVQLNPCIVRVETQQYRWLYFDGETESFQETPAAAALNAAVGKLLELPARRLPFTELQNVCADLIEAEPEVLQAFILDLLDTGLLEWVLPEPGLGPGWAGKLYQYLGFLPATPLIVRAAELLLWLKTAARTLPHQEPTAMQETQREGVRLLREFFEQAGAPPPDIQPEQLFFEDVLAPPGNPWPIEAIQRWAETLAKCTVGATLAAARGQDAVARGRDRTPRARALTLLDRVGEDEISFLDFAKRFFEEDEKPGTPTNPQSTIRIPHSILGALVQPFQENGRLKAAVNAVYPGGGRLFARWLHLLPTEFSSDLQTWQEEHGLTPFPGQGWHNANFQPASVRRALATPGGRVTGKESILLGNLYLRRGEDGWRLADAATGAPVVFTDLNLEAAETRAPSWRLLAALGLPEVSLRHLPGWDTPPTERGAGVWYYPRVEVDDLVLRRARWRVDSRRWTERLGKDPTENFRFLYSDLQEIGAPEQFFVRREGEKPQYVKRGSPLLMDVFLKWLRRRPEQPVWLEEMLPARRDSRDGFAEEIAFEFRVG